MAQKHVGIDLGSHSVKVAVVTAGLRGVNVLNTFEERVIAGEGEDALTASTRVAIQILRERGLTHMPTGIALPGGLGNYRVLKFPFGDQKRIAQAISFELEGQFATPIASLEYDHVVGPASGSGGRALVIAVKRDPLDQTVEAFRRAGADVRLVTVAPVALAQILTKKLAPLPPDADDYAKPAALIIDIGERTTELVAVTDKVPIAIRTLRRGGRLITRALQKAYGFDQAGAEVAKERDAFLPHEGLGNLTPDQQASAGQTARALEPIVREIEHTRMWLASECNSELTELRLTGGSAELKGLVPYLQEQLEVPVHLAEPGDTVGLRGTTDTRWTRASVAVGAAFASAKRPIIQLYDVTAVTSDGNWLQDKFMTLASLGIAIVAFAAVDTIVKVKAMEAERDQYVAELESISSTVFGEALSSLTDVEERLAAVDGAALTDQLPDRGAFEVFEMITKAAAPTDSAQAPPANAALGEGGVDGAAAGDPNAMVTGTAPDGSPTMLDPSGNPLGVGPGAPPDEGAEDGGATADGPVDPDAGIVASDQLLVRYLDIRELKISMKLDATRATAQDRLALKLQSLGCITDIKKGKVRDSNDRKQFELEMSHNCFRANQGEGS